MDTILDDWRMYNRECVSFVAWRLASRNGFNMPFHASASSWANLARQRGYSVNTTPAVGSVAYSANHVAWVQAVDGPNIMIEEYNNVDSNGNGVYGDDGTYGSRTVAKSKFSGFIHFKDIGVVAGSSTTNHSGKMVRHPSGTIAFVAYNGLKYWVPDMQTVNCLGGGGNIAQLEASIFDSIPSYPLPASCSKIHISKMVRSPAGTIGYVDASGLKHWVPTMEVVTCLGGISNVVQLDNANFDSIPGSPPPANCLSGNIGRLIRNSIGTISYVDSNTIQHWVPNGQVVTCLGGGGSVIQIDDSSMAAIDASVESNCSSINLGKMILAPNGTVAYLSSSGRLHWVRDSHTVSCLGGWGAISSVDWSTWGQFPTGEPANCSTRF